MAGWLMAELSSRCERAHFRIGAAERKWLLSNCGLDGRAASELLL
jgi:hypothetical protein